MNFFLIISLFLLGFLSVTIVNFVTGRKLKGRYAPTEIPQSINLLRVTHLITLALLLEKISEPFADLSNVLHNSLTGWDLLLKQCVYISLFFTIILVVYLALSWVTSISYSIFTKRLAPLEDAMEGNISNILLFSGIQIALVIVVRSGIPDLLSVLIPYPNLPAFH